MFNEIKLENFVIVGIDPGISHMGLSAMSVTPDLSKVTSIYAKTIHGDDADLDIPSSSFIDDRFCKILHHDRSLTRWIKMYKPSYVIYERPFIHGSRPTAYGALVESICCIKNAVYKCSPFIDIHEYTPLTIKKSVSAHNFKGKEFMTEALVNIPEIYNLIRNQMSNLDEHSIDSIAIAYTHLKNLRDGLV